jgi:hypothetical protein
VLAVLTSAWTELASTVYEIQNARELKLLAETLLPLSENFKIGHES